MRIWVFLAGLSGAMGVAMGAYSAHGLAGDSYLQGLGTQAALYEVLHAVALVAADRLAADGRRPAHGAAFLFLVGTVLFCGSIYVHVLTGDTVPIPMVTPTGGVSFILGWLMLALSAFGGRRRL